MARSEPLFRRWELLRARYAHRFGFGTDELAKRPECKNRDS